MIARQSTIVTANNVLGAAQGFVALFVIARYMGDAVLGARAFAIALVAIAGLVARLGLPMTHVRRLARGEDVAESNGAFATLKLVLVAAFAILGLIVGWIYFHVLGKSPTDTTPAALWMAFAIVILQGLRDVPVHSFQGLRLIVEREAVLFTNTLATVTLTVTAAVAYASSHGRWTPLPGAGERVVALLGIEGPLDPMAGLQLVMTALLVAEASAFVLAIALFLWRRIPMARPRGHHVRDYVLFTLPLMLLSIGEVVTKWIGQAAVGLFGNAADSGHYAAAAKLTEAFLLLPASLAVVLLPATSRLHAERRDEDAAALVRTSARIVSALSWPLVAVLVVASAAVVHILLSDAFGPAQWPLRILALQSLLTGLLLPVQALAVGLGRTRQAARAVVWSLVVTAGLDLLLVPPSILGVRLADLGATGAALGALAGTVVAVTLYLRPQDDWPGHDLALRHVLKHAACAVAAGAAVWLLPAPERITGLLGTVVVALAVYLVGLWALREIDVQDLAAWRRGLRGDP